jgi:CubicO group peptidase (beta-lactamase class C family)
MKYLFILIAASALCPAVAQLTESPPASEGFSAQRLARLDAFLENMVRQQQLPNVVTFVARHGKVIHHKAYGFRNTAKGEALRRDDIFRIASQTKAITSVALMMLYEEGRFLLDDPVSMYLPDFAAVRVLDKYDPKTKTFTTRAPARPLTVRHLLSHMAGMPYDNPVPGRPGYDGHQFLPGQSTDTLPAMIARLAKTPLIADPGDKYIYGPATDVVGRMIEVLSGMTLDAFFRQRIFIPLGMNDTYFFLPDSKANRLVELYSIEKANDIPSPATNDGWRTFPLRKPSEGPLLGGAGLVGPVGDYARFCQMILDGGTFNGHRLLSPATVALMCINQIGELTVRDRNDKYSLAFQLITAGTRYADLASPGAVTWGGMFSTEYTIDFHKDLIMLVYTNVNPNHYETELVRKFRILVYQALEE